MEISIEPKNFIDDCPILKIFETINIIILNQKPLDIDENISKKLTLTNSKINNEDIEFMINNLNEKPMIYVEKQIFMNIISYLCLNKEDDSKYYEKAKEIAKYFTNSIYREKLRKPGQENKKKINLKWIKRWN